MVLDTMCDWQLGLSNRSLITRGALEQVIVKHGSTTKQQATFLMSIK